MVKPPSRIFFVLCIICLMAIRPSVFAQEAEPARTAGSALTAEQQMQEVLLRLQQEYAARANQIADHYVKSQQALYTGRHQIALQHIDSALRLTVHADLYAFQGAIYYEMGQEALARQAFQKAFSLDNKLPLPAVAGLEAWLRKINLLP